MELLSKYIPFAHHFRGFPNVTLYGRHKGHV